MRAARILLVLFGMVAAPAWADPSEADPSGKPDESQATARTRATNEYRWVVTRKFFQHLPNLTGTGQGGTVVIRMVIARDGRLLEARVAKSSGEPALDNGMLEAIRAAAPYPPMPPEIPGDKVVFNQPVTATPSQ